jgi:hypothetical protein
MVNGWFPEPGMYGFERVDAAAASLDHGISLINRKFTPSQIIRNFREFSPL